jgi:hypothetical protein
MGRGHLGERDLDLSDRLLGRSQSRERGEDQPEAADGVIIGKPLPAGNAPCARLPRRDPASMCLPGSPSRR